MAVKIIGMRPAELYLDTLDDRREIWHLLAKLPPSRRVAFVDGCCRITAKDGMKKGVAAKTRRLATLAMRDDEADERLTTDLYFDIWHLAMQYSLNLLDVAKRLERLVRKGAP